jgi:hypothetical protein
MTSSGSTVFSKREAIIVLDDDEDIVVINPKKEFEENISELPKQRRTGEAPSQGRDQYVDLCQENLDNEVECKVGKNFPNKKRGNCFPQDESKNMNVRHRGLVERGGVNADVLAAAAAMPDVPQRVELITLVRLSPNSNEYREVSAQ